MKRKFHPVSALFPPLAPDELAALEASIAERGVLVPVAVDAEGCVVDGRNRAEIADRLGLEVPTRPVEGDPWLFARSINLDRRNLSAQQRAAVLLRAEREGFAPEVAAIRDAAGKRAKASAPGRKTRRSDDRRDGEAAEEIGALVGVSGTTVKRVQRAAETAGALERIERGQSTAEEEIRAAGKATQEQIEGAFWPEPVPVFDAWWRACGTLMQRVRVDGMEEEWGPDERRKVLEWTPRIIERLREVERVARDAPALTTVKGGKR